jgi:hypothetical protein
MRRRRDVCHQEDDKTNRNPKIQDAKNSNSHSNVCGFDVARHCHVKNFILDVIYFLNTNRRFGSQPSFRLHMKLEEAHNL